MTERDERVWERGWDGHADAQRARLARLPLAEKIAWLEEAQVVLGHLTQPTGETRAPGAGRRHTEPPARSEDR